MRNLSYLDISIYQMEMFLILAEDCNFSRAAERLHMTQPTLSKRIVQLEDTIGLKLFDRDKRPITLTRAGENLRRTWEGIVKTIVDSIEKERAIEHQATIPHIMIGVMESGKRLKAVDEVLNELEDEYPELNCSWSYHSLKTWKNALRDGQVDFVIGLLRSHDLKEDWLERVPLFRIQKLACMRPKNPLATKNVIEPEDLKDMLFVSNSPESVLARKDSVVRFGLQHGFYPRFSKLLDNPSLLIGAITRDDEVAICDAYHRDIPNPHQVFIPIRGCYNAYALYYNKENINPYLDICRERICNSFVSTGYSILE